jgi:hypothetical protein
MVATNKRLESVVKAALPGASVHSGPELADGSELVVVDAGTGALSLRAQWVGNGWPQDVRETLEAVEEGAWPSDLVLIARRFSPGAVELLAARGANWADESGAAQIRAPGLVVFREGSAIPERPRARGWSQSAREIAELLLSMAWLEGFGTTELANLSGWSSPQVSQVLQSFDEQGWTSKYGPGRGRGAKRELVDPSGLLESWSLAVNESAPAPREASKSLVDPVSFLREELAGALSGHVRWALGGWAAAQEVAPFVTTVPTLQIYVHEEDMSVALEAAMREAGLREIPEGGRIQFIPAAASVLARSWGPKGIPLASMPRIYADLGRLGPRGVEAAEHLKEEAIDPLHRGGRRPGAPPDGLIVWEGETQARLRDRIKASPDSDIKDRYRDGTYSASYRLQGVETAPTLAEFKTILESIVGRETGWPAWMMPERPRSYENTIEAWLDNTVFNDPSHADFWRADPSGRMCLIRGYDEDGLHSPLVVGSGIDLTLPVWRVGECLLHASRLAERLGATGIEFMIRWDGLAGRELVSYAEPKRRLGGEYRCHQDAVVSYVESSPARIGPELVGLVASLVGPLFAAFELFEATTELYEEELARMRSRTGEMA